MLFGAEKSDGVIKQDVILNFIGEMPARNEFESGGGADTLISFQDSRWLGAKLPIVDFNRSRGHPVEIWV